MKNPSHGDFFPTQCSPPAFANTLFLPSLPLSLCVYSYLFKSCFSISCLSWQGEAFFSSSRRLLCSRTAFVTPSGTCENQKSGSRPRVNPIYALSPPDSVTACLRGDAVVAAVRIHKEASKGRNGEVYVNIVTHTRVLYGCLLACVCGYISLCLPGGLCTWHPALAPVSLLGRCQRAAVG